MKTGPWHKVSDELFNRSNTKEKVCAWQSLQEALLQCWSVLTARSVQAHPKCCRSNEHACKVLRIQGEECQSALLLVAPARAATQLFCPRIIFRLETNIKSPSSVLIPTFGLFRLQLDRTNLHRLLECKNGTSSFGEPGLRCEDPNSHDEGERDRVLEPESRAPRTG